MILKSKAFENSFQAKSGLTRPEAIYSLCVPVSVNTIFQSQYIMFDWGAAPDSARGLG